MADRTQEIVLRVRADSGQAARQLGAVASRLDALTVAFGGAAEAGERAGGALRGLSLEGAVTKNLGALSRGLAKVASAEQVGRLQELTAQLRDLADQAARIRDAAGELRPLMGSLARGAAGGATIAGGAGADFGPIKGQLDGIQAAARAAGVDVAALGGDVTKLGKAMDSATDPLNELRNGIDGLGDRLVLFGAQGERFRNEIEEIRDPALRAKIANEQWAQAQGNLNGLLGRAGDQLQVLKIRAAGAVGGIDNLNRLVTAGAVGVGLLVAGLVKLGGVLLEVAQKGLKEYQGSLEKAAQKTAFLEAQTKSVDQSVGSFVEKTLGATAAQDGFSFMVATVAERLERLGDTYQRLPGPLRATIESQVEFYGALSTGQTWLVGFGQRSRDAAQDQRELQAATERASETLRGQADALRQTEVAWINFGNNAFASINKVADELARMNALERAIGKGDAGEVSRIGAAQRRGGGGGARQRIEADLSSRGLGGLFGGALEGARDLTADLAAQAERSTASFGLMGEIFQTVVQPAATDAFASMSDFMAQAQEQTRALLTLTDNLGQSMVNFGGFALQGFTAFALGATSAGGFFGSLISNLGQIASSAGSFLLLAGAGFQALPLGFTAAGAVGAGAGLLALGAALGVAGAALSSGGGASAASAGGGGARTFVAPSLGERPELAQNRRTEIVLQVGREVLGRVIEDEVNARISLNRILNVPAVAR